MQKKQRLTGIDLLRGIGIFAVVILHSDEGILVKPPIWTSITQFSGFAVPFFLATSFYLTIERLYSMACPYNLLPRMTRLLIPYGIWSIIYLLYKTIKYALKDDFGKLIEIFQDPLAIIFFGGAAFHLYFLPLLLAGTVTLKFTEFLIRRRVNINYLILLCILSLSAYQWLLMSKNSFILESNTAFQAIANQEFLENNPILRLFLGELAWIVRCLPYIFLATILHNQNIKEVWVNIIDRNVILCCAWFLILNIYGNLLLPESIYEVFRGYAALLAAISLSTKLKEHTIIANLGTCSFGMYLVHLLIVEALQTIATKMNFYSKPVSTVSLFVFAMFTFLVSWIVVFYINRQKSIAKLLFGT